MLGEDGLDGLTSRVSELIDETEISQALEAIWTGVRRLNRYVEETRPWDLAKDEGSAGDLDRVLYNLAEGLRYLALLLHPYIPASTDALLGALGEDSRELSPFGSGGAGRAIELLDPLFPKLED